MKKQFTATVYVFHENKVLLGLHEKLGRLLPPGGHVEPCETLEEAALREVKEETSLDVELFGKEPFAISTPTAKSIKAPYLILLEKMPPTPKEEAHEHIDCIFLGKLKDLKQKPFPNFRWFSFEELCLIPDHLIFPEVITICQPFLSPLQENIREKPPSLLELLQLSKNDFLPLVS